MNDLKDYLDDSRFILLYADDLQIYVQVPEEQINQGICMLSDSVKIVSTWAELNCLALNTKKTQAIIFGSPNTIKLFKELQTLKIIVNHSGDGVLFVDEIISLGVTLDNTLSWQPKIKQLTRKINRVLYGLRIIKPCTSQTLRKRLIQSLIVAH